ncbi:hypothetical protein [Escherichia coli]|uniref:hypothetical protein n=1 Tax=Escherichia coli TaxID=562 RepID=UPI00313D0B1F
MTDSTLLDPLAVVSSALPDDQSPDGPLIIADKKWLAGSIFHSVMLTRADAVCLRPDVSSGADVLCLETSFTERPLFSSLTCFTAPLLNTCRLVDTATDVLAKEIANIPEVDPTGRKHYSESDRLLFFRNAIADRVRRFLLDELPRFMVETLGHAPFEIYSCLWLDLQKYYQLMFLLSGRKAGFNAPFMYHHLPSFVEEGAECDLPLSVAKNWREVRFCFDCETAMGFGADNDFFDFYLPATLLDCGINPEEKEINRFQRWQILSFKGDKPVSKSHLLKQVLADGLLHLATEDLVSRFFAKEVVRCGVKCNHWRGIYKPAINFDY